MKQENKYGCLMVEFDIPTGEWIGFTTALIKENELYDEEGYGREIQPHTTILYGLHDDFKLEDVFKYLLPLNSLRIFSSKIDTFSNQEFDVVKFNIECDALHHMNSNIRKNFNYTSKFPDYHPHATIGYLKSGCGEKYVRELSKPYIFRPINYLYSDSRGNSVPFIID